VAAPGEGAAASLVGRGGMRDVGAGGGGGDAQGEHAGARAAAP